MSPILRSAFSWCCGPARWGCFAALAMFPASLRADDLVRIEEDWQLVLATPDSNSAGPQVACTLSPVGNIDDTYFTVEFNHRSVPYWSPGGITLHQWNGEWRVQSMDRPDRSLMQTQNETVTWTQILDVSGNVLTFQIKNGASTTWGPFGYSNNLKLQTYWYAGNINGYSPDVSSSRSGVAYASNRVQSLKLLRVRGTFSSGNVVTDNTVRVAFELSDP